MTFEDLKKEKLLKIGSITCAFMFSMILIYENTEFFKIIICSALFFVYTFLDIMEFKRLNDLAEMCQMMKKQFTKQKRHLAHIKELTANADPNKLHDSIFLTNQFLKELALEKNVTGCFKYFEVDQEFDSIFILKRKSTPIDEILELLHKENHL